MCLGPSEDRAAPGLQLVPAVPVRAFLVKEIPVMTAMTPFGVGCGGHALARTIALTIVVLSATAAVHAQPLVVRWENRGQTELEGAVLDLATEGNVVVAAGNVCTATNTSTCNWFVRAIDTSMGTTLWEDRLNVGLFDRSQGVAISGNRVFASGWFQTTTGGFDFVVRAYDMRDGTTLWQQRIARGGFFEFAELVGAKGNRVYAVGRVLGETLTSDFTVFAFDARTGTIVWESVLDTFRTDVAFSLSEQGDRVFAVGPVNNFFDLLVRAYDGLTGASLWERTITNGSQFVRNRSLAVHGGLLYLGAGVFLNNGTEDAIVHAYDQHTGQLVWARQFNTGGFFNEASVVTVQGNYLLAAGAEGCDEFFLACVFSTRAFDARTGEHLWQDAFQDAAGADSFAQSVAVSSGRVFAGGWAADENDVYQWRMRVLEVKSGAVIADEVSTGATGSGLNAIVAAGSTVFTGGFLGRPAAGGEFTVRAYR
jgi:outer membrane protein assembly factor BamB